MWWDDIERQIIYENENIMPTKIQFDGKMWLLSYIGSCISCHLISNVVKQVIECYCASLL